ncbi:restriction endonuclease subunit S [Anaerobutyricum soehngenii]|uniref:restriction endonuclease subunit S n=1 Tax=Anaerobutyricum soehngenii TaxID=105843 RepID=UPI0032C15650
MDKIWIYVWKQRKLGEVFEQTTNFVNPDKGEIELWSLTVEDGLTPKSERYNREFLVKKNANFKKVRPGDIVYNPMNMTLGAVGYNGMLKNVAVSGYYITMFVKTGYDSYYINTWLKSPQALSLYKTFATGSLIEKQRVQFSTLSIIPTVFPEYEEQKRIGCYFNNLDSLITFHHRKLNILNKICRYAWEQRKVLDLLIQPITDGPHETPKLVEKGVPFISVDAIVDNKIDFNRKRGNISEEYDELCCKKYKPQFHDVYLVKSGSTVGKVAIVETTDRFNIWSPLAAMRCGEKTYPYFLYDLLQTKDLQAQVADKASNGTQPNLSMRELEKFPVSVPSNLEEQKKIGDYFRSLDHLITLHQQKCKQLQIIRKFMLKNMFL